MINLVLAERSRQYVQDDLRAIAVKVRQLAPDISIRLLLGRQGPVNTLRAALARFAPTLVVDMSPRESKFGVSRGHRLGHWQAGDKLREFRLLSDAGFPVPPWTEISPDTALDPDEWGPYVVVKPSRGMRGAWVWIRKTGRVRYRPPEDYPEGHFGRISPMIAQKFVYTGPWPVAYRVLSFLGCPLVAIRYDGRRDIAPLNSSYDFRATGGHSIVANAMGCTISCVNDADIIDLATRVHVAMPDVPSLGVDMIREADSGQLYVMETNPVGHSWILSCSMGQGMQQEFGLDFYGQFGALDIAAQAAIESARRLAV